jgi:hypothetical protein
VVGIAVALAGAALRTRTSLWAGSLALSGRWRAGAATLLWSAHCVEDSGGNERVKVLVWSFQLIMYFILSL